MNLREKAFLFIATGFGIGYIPLIPGTFGTLPGLPICYFLAQVPTVVAGGFIIIIISVSMWVAGKAEKYLGQKDPGKIVIDEIAGLTVALVGLPFNLFNVVAGFIAFRIFDVLKPFPLRRFEKLFPGGIGVVMDDIGAGIYANILIRLVLWIVEMIR